MISISPFLCALGFAVLMAGLLIEVTIFRAIHADPPGINELFALRDKLVHLVVEGEIDREEPHFEALYRNVNILLSGCLRLSGPDPDDHVKPLPLPAGALPPALEPIVIELRAALEHIIGHHFGLNLVMNGRSRQHSRIRRANAKALLKIMPCPA